MKCNHENATVEVKQVLYSQIHDNEAHDGDLTPVSYFVDCPECGLIKNYYQSRLPQWLQEIVRSVGIKVEEELWTN